MDEIAQVARDYFKVRQVGKVWPNDDATAIPPPPPGTYVVGRIDQHDKVLAAAGTYIALSMIMEK